MDNKVKVVSYTWWICGIIGLMIGLAKADGRINTYGVMAFAGIVNGVFWGWILGLIIDKIKDSAAVVTITKKIEEIKEEQEVIKQTKESLDEYNDSKHRFQFLSDETLITKYKEYEEQDKSDMIRLALEEELVKRGILSHSPMHEKLEKLRTMFSQKES